MDEKISREYYYISGDILDEYASCYSQVDKERLAKTLQDLVNEKVEKFAERMKEQYPPRTDKRCSLDDCYMLDKIDEICKEITGAE
jgi:hypothetical protein